MRMRKRGSEQGQLCNDSVLHGHPGSWFTTGEHTKRDSGSLSSTFFQHTGLLRRAAKNKHILKQSTERETRGTSSHKLPPIFYVPRKKKNPKEGVSGEVGGDESSILNMFHCLLWDVQMEISNRQLNVDRVWSSRERKTGWRRLSSEHTVCARLCPPEAPSGNEALVPPAARTVACWWPRPNPSPGMTLYQRKLPCPSLCNYRVHAMTGWWRVTKTCPLRLSSGHFCKAFSALEFPRTGWCHCWIYIASPASFIPLPGWFLIVPPSTQPAYKSLFQNLPENLSQHRVEAEEGRILRGHSFRSLSVTRKEDSWRRVLSKEDFLSIVDL